MSARLSELRRHLLPRKFDPTGTYADRVHDRARAYRLLAHAEIEWTIEQLVFTAANEAYNHWRSNGRVGRTLICLLAFLDGSQDKVPTSLPSKGPPQLFQRVERAKNEFCTYVLVENHGIRERNLLKLLLPVGVREADLDPIWLATVDSFAQSRGEAAHRSNRVVSPPDPRTEYSTVSQIVVGIRNLDAKLLSLSRAT